MKKFLLAITVLFSYECLAMDLSDDQLDALLRDPKVAEALKATAHTPGTARMGNIGSGIVEGQLQVFGVQNRYLDMPDPAQTARHNFSTIMQHDWDETRIGQQHLINDSWTYWTQ